MAVERSRRAPPRLRHAQHFLRSTHLAAEIVREANLGRDDVVLDIGAGEGALTAELARRCDRVRAIEIDSTLVARLGERFGRTERVEIVHADALRLRWPEEPFRVVANIPFNACTAICRRLLDDPSVPLARADLVVELAAAWKRARVSPSTALGAYWGAWYEFAVTRRIDRSAFAPPPGTDAGLLRITRRADPLVEPAEAADYRGLVRAGFEHRALRHVVSRRQLKRLARELGFAADAPPWELDQHQWAGVHRFVRSRG